MFTIGIAVFISDNDQLKVAGTDYVNVTSVCMCCDNVTKNKKAQSSFKKFSYSFNT